MMTKEIDVVRTIKSGELVTLTELTTSVAYFCNKVAVDDFTIEDMDQLVFLTERLLKIIKGN
jgi:hypothetical protein